MKTVLVVPTALGKSIPQTKWQQPLGVTYIAACIKQISDVSIIDCNLDENYENRLIKEINTTDQIIVGFSTNSYTYSESLRLAKLVKRSNPNVHITFGGYHATPLAKQVLINRDFVDSVVRGDGEIPFRELVTSLSLGNDFSKVRSLTFRKEGIIVSNPNAPLPELDMLPFPARDLLQLDECLSNFKDSLFHKKYNISRIFYVSANRGCPNKCNFCSIFNKELRTRDTAMIVDEIEYLINKYKADSIYLVGDNLNADKDWFLSFCRTIINRGVNIKWICATMNPILINNEIISMMEKSGCIRATISFESGSQKMLDALNKRRSMHRSKQTANILKSSDIDVVATFVLGAPGESEETLSNTVDFIKISHFNACQASILSPLPGSGIFYNMLNIYPQYNNSDFIDLSCLQEKYICNYCDTDFARIRQVR